MGAQVRTGGLEARAAAQLHSIPPFDEPEVNRSVGQAGTVGL